MNLVIAVYWRLFLAVSSHEKVQNVNCGGIFRNLYRKMKHTIRFQKTIYSPKIKKGFVCQKIAILDLKTASRYTGGDFTCQFPHDMVSPCILTSLIAMLNPTNPRWSEIRISMRQRKKKISTNISILDNLLTYLTLVILVTQARLPWRA